MHVVVEGRNKIVLKLSLSEDLMGFRAVKSASLRSNHLMAAKRPLYNKPMGHPRLERTWRNKGFFVERMIE